MEGDQMTVERCIRGAVLGLALLGVGTTRAHAHFTLRMPTSWLNEDALGGPQKGSPCGPGNTRPFVGDDVQPIPASGAVTTFHAGETITVQWQETVYHPGYFRISLAPTDPASATNANFPNPALSDPDNCIYDKAAVATGPHDNVLADGLFMVDAQDAPTRSLMQDVKLPDEPCDPCTLQVVQVMEAHPEQSCFYFHCAEIKVLPAQAVDAGAPVAEGPHAHHGCSVAELNARGSRAGAWSLLGIAGYARRRRRLG
jgi:hypothetical protein